MTLAITSLEAWVFLPLVLPVCLYVIWTDLSRMKITNGANIALLAVFVLLGFFVLPLGEYGWRIAQVGIVLVVAFVANMLGAMGAGDSKFLAAAAPFVAPGDYSSVLLMLMAITIAAVITHRAAKHSRLRQIAPDWESWHREGKFPMGFALGTTLSVYLIAGALQGV